jgi:hypothetical protein
MRILLLACLLALPPVATAADFVTVTLRPDRGLAQKGHLVRLDRSALTRIEIVETRTWDAYPFDFAVHGRDLVYRLFCRSLADARGLVTILSPGAEAETDVTGRCRLQE